MPTFIEQQNTKPISLTKLKFSKLDHALEIGSGAFNGIDVDELTTYSNMYGAATLEENYTIGHFAGAKINKLNVEYVDGFESAGDGALFSYIKANQVNVGEGITEIAEVGFYTKDNSQCFIQNINLPKTINTINNRSLLYVKNINFEAGHCNDVKINELAWLSDSVITPSTCVTGQNME